jgi:uncharacterized protein YndB with AHSA1/START domain
VSAADSPVLRLERTYDAPAEDVFDAWTNPEVLRRWWVASPSWRTPVADVDLRVGGSYRLSMEDPDAGTVRTVTGEYREVNRPRRLVYSWCWEEAEGVSGEVSTVTVEFVRDGERTKVVLEHSELSTAESRDGHRRGWEACMEILAARVFAKAPQPS